MGILYHHRDPLGVLTACERGLKKNGLLVMESMTIDDDRSICLFPEDRYAMARNVYFLPSTTALVSLCKRAGFLDVDVISDRPTTLDEQRTTEWMPFKSLKEFLDPDDIKKTVEGYPAPKRTIVVCKKRG
jgi:tRNA (mo5U34)-methyltransferase